MEPAPIKTEMPPMAPKPEAKPTQAPLVPEQPQPKTETAPGEKTARSTLEAIANGTPVAEAVSLPDREKVDALLMQANELLLELRDMRLVMTAIASNAANTPLGNEIRLDTLRMMTSMSNADMPPDAVIKLDALQKHITELNLPPTKPEESALLPIIAQYNEAHPNKAVPPEVIDQIKSGSRDASATIAQLLQTNTDLAQPIWKELTGVDGFNGLNLTPNNILELAKLPTTPENVAKANDMFTTIQNMPPEEQRSLMEALTPILMLSALGIMTFTQMTGQGEGGGGGH